MRLTGSDLQALSGTKLNFVSGKLDGQLSSQDVEKLAGAAVVMTDLRRPGRHSLLNDAQSICPDQVPAITAVAPRVMLGRCFLDHVRSLTGRCSEARRS